MNPPGAVDLAASLLAHTIAVFSVASGHGTTVDSLATLSRVPPLVSVALVRGGRTERLARTAESFAVSVLSGEQADLAARFASRRRPAGLGQFHGAGWLPAPAGGSPVLTEAPLWLECVRHAVVPAGDHTLIVGEVVAAGTGPAGPPLVRLGGRWLTTGQGISTCSQVGTNGVAASGIPAS